MISNKQNIDLNTYDISMRRALTYKHRDRSISIAYKRG